MRFQRVGREICLTKDLWLMIMFTCVHPCASFLISVHRFLLVYIVSGRVLILLRWDSLVEVSSVFGAGRLPLSKVFSDPALVKASTLMELATAMTQTVESMHKANIRLVDLDVSTVVVKNWANRGTVSTTRVVFNNCRAWFHEAILVSVLYIS